MRGSKSKNATDSGDVSTALGGYGCGNLSNPNLSPEETIRRLLGICGATRPLVLKSAGESKTLVAIW
jgi:hypothetical protein